MKVEVTDMELVSTGSEKSDKNLKLSYEYKNRLKML